VASELKQPNRLGFTPRYAVFTTGSKTVSCFDPSTGAVRALVTSKRDVRAVVPVDLGPTADGVLVVEAERLLYVEIRNGAAASTKVLVDGTGRFGLFDATFNQRRVYWLANHRGDSAKRLRLESREWDSPEVVEHCALPALGADVRALRFLLQGGGPSEQERVFVLCSNSDRSFVYAQGAMQVSVAETIFWHLGRFEFLQADTRGELVLEVGRCVYNNAELVRFSPNQNGIPPGTHPPTQHSQIETMLVAPDGISSLASDARHVAWTTLVQDGVVGSMVQCARREGSLPYAIETVSRDHVSARSVCLRGDGLWWLDAAKGELWHASRVRGAAAE